MLIGQLSYYVMTLVYYYVPFDSANGDHISEISDTDKTVPFGFVISVRAVCYEFYSRCGPRLLYHVQACYAQRYEYQTVVYFFSTARFSRMRTITRLPDWQSFLRPRDLFTGHTQLIIHFTLDAFTSL